LLETVRLTDDVESDHYETPEPTVVATSTSNPLPSPLLCPHHTFLVSLILVSKFSQNKCYFNRTWAKLSRLPEKLDAANVGSSPRLTPLAMGRQDNTNVTSSVATPPVHLIPLYGLRARVVSVSSRSNLEALSMGAAWAGRCATFPTEFYWFRVTFDPFGLCQGRRTIQ
jgi:hypothetical protein